MLKLVKLLTNDFIVKSKIPPPSFHPNIDDGSCTILILGNLGTEFETAA